MTWHIQYRKDGTDHIERHPSPERAIEAACRLIDDGCDVYGVGTVSLTDSIERDQIDRIYAMWVRVKLPLGISISPHYRHSGSGSKSARSKLSSRVPDAPFLECG
jgi:hypothetical protein